MKFETLGRPLGFMDGICIEDRIWFVDHNLKKLVNIRLDTGEMTIAELPAEVLYLYRRVLKRGNNVYWITNDGCNICCGRVESGVTLDKMLSFHDFQNVRIKDAFLIGDKIWCIPCSTEQHLMIFDVLAEEFSVKKPLDDVASNFDGNKKQEGIMTVKNICGDIYFTKESGKSLYQYDCMSECITEWKMPEGILISGFDGDGETFWIRNKKGIELYEWNRKLGIVSTFQLDEQCEMEKTELNAKVVVLSNEQVMLLPTFSNSIVYLDKIDGNLKRIGETDDFVHMEGRERGTFSIGNMIWENQLLLFPWSQEKLISINLEQMLASKVEIVVSEDTYNYLKWEKYEKIPLQIETKEYGIRGKLRLTSKFEKKPYDRVENDVYGTKIYNELKKEYEGRA